MKKILLTTLLSSVLLSGCVAPGTDLESNAYTPNQINTQQELIPVVIQDVIPAKVKVSNRERQKLARTGGVLLGALTGAVIGDNTNNAGTGAIIGAVAGGAVGNLVQDGTTLVSGVTIIYKVLTGAEAGKIYTSSQVGRRCMFQRGNAYLIRSSNKALETRVQPNGVCD